MVTTSWDDGDACDLRITELLRFRDLKGTFYVPTASYKGRPALRPAELRRMASEGFEVGAHGILHEDLSNLPAKELSRVVGTCKGILEDILGNEVQMFCYPGGRYNSRAVMCLREAGYQGARTTQVLATELDFSWFEMPTSLQAYPHRRTAYIKNAARAGNIARLCRYVIQLSRRDGWVELGKGLFDRVMREGGIWHLYGHSWEIEELDLWQDLERILDHVRGQKGVFYLTNGDVVNFLQARTQVCWKKQRES